MVWHLHDNTVHDWDETYQETKHATRIDCSLSANEKSRSEVGDVTEDVVSKQTASRDVKVSSWGTGIKF